MLGSRAPASKSSQNSPAHDVAASAPLASAGGNASAGLDPSSLGTSASLASGLVRSPLSRGRSAEREASSSTSPRLSSDAAASASLPSTRLSSDEASRELPAPESRGTEEAGEHPQTRRTPKATTQPTEPPVSLANQTGARRNPFTLRLRSCSGRELASTRDVLGYCELASNPGPFEQKNWGAEPSTGCVCDG